MSMYNPNEIVPCRFGCRHNLVISQMVFPPIAFIISQTGIKPEDLTGDKIKEHACCTVHQKRFNSLGIKEYPYKAVISYVSKIPGEKRLKCIKCSDELLERDANTPDLESIAAYLKKDKVADEGEIAAHHQHRYHGKGTTLESAKLYFYTLYSGTSFHLGGRSKSHTAEPAPKLTRAQRRAAKAMEEQRRTNEVLLAAVRAKVTSAVLIDKATEKGVTIDEMSERIQVGRRLHEAKARKKRTQQSGNHSNANAA